MRTDFLRNFPVKLIGSNLKMVTAAVAYGFQLHNRNCESHIHPTLKYMKETTFRNILFGLHVILCGMVSQEVCGEDYAQPTQTCWGLTEHTTKVHLSSFGGGGGTG